MRALALLYAAALLGIVALADSGALGSYVHGVHTIPMGDKVAHLVLATMLGYFAASYPRVPRVARIPITVPFVIVVATLEEISQQFIPGRTYDLRDLAADFLGIAIGTALALHRHRAIGH